MKSHGITNGQKSETNIMKYIGKVCWFMDNTECLCPVDTNCLQNTDNNDDATEVFCASLRRILEISAGRNEASFAMKCTFRFIPDMEDMRSRLNEEEPESTGGRSVGPSCEDEVFGDNVESCSDEDVEGSSERCGDLERDGWVVVRYGQYFDVEYIIESMLENVALCLTEPVT